MIRIAHPSDNKPTETLRGEISLIASRGRNAWNLIPPAYRAALVCAALLMGITSGSNTAIALLLGRLIDRLKPGATAATERYQLYWAVGFILVSLAITYIIREALNVVRRSLVETAVARIKSSMQLQLIDHAMKGDLVALGGEKIGSLHGKIFRSVDGLVRFTRLMFLECFPALLTGAFALFAAVSKEPTLGLVMLGVVPAAVGLTLRQLRSQKDVRLRMMRNDEEIDGAVVEQLSGAEYVRAANTHDLEINRLSHVMEERRSREVRHHFTMSLFGSAKAINEGLFHVAVLAVASYLAIEGRISYGDVLTFSVLFLNVMTPLSEIHRVMDEGHEASLRVGELVQMLEEPQDVAFQTPASTPHAVLRLGEPVFHLENVLSTYRSAEGKTVRALDDLWLSVHHGETIGIAGRSGSGKSTSIKLLLRLLHPETGRILLGGKPLSDVSRQELASLIGYVGQNPFLFAGTVAQNIGYGHTNATMDDIMHAAKLAYIHHEIMAMPNGYQTKLTERGQNLSGGQRQRLAIARVLLKKSPILILDEATSALDNISERHVLNSLNKTSAHRTTMVIAHRLTTLKDCDRIVVFHEGKIAEVGTFNELLKRGGIFAELSQSAERSTTEGCDFEPAEELMAAAC